MILPSGIKMARHKELILIMILNLLYVSAVLRVEKYESFKEINKFFGGRPTWENENESLRLVALYYSSKSISCQLEAKTNREITMSSEFVLKTEPNSLCEEEHIDKIYDIDKSMWIYLYTVTPLYDYYFFGAHLINCSATMYQDDQGISVNALFLVTINKRMTDPDLMNPKTKWKIELRFNRSTKMINIYLFQKYGWLPLTKSIILFQIKTMINLSMNITQRLHIPVLYVDVIKLNVASSGFWLHREPHLQAVDQNKIVITLNGEGLDDVREVYQAKLFLIDVNKTINIPASVVLMYDYDADQQVKDYGFLMVPQTRNQLMYTIHCIILYQSCLTELRNDARNLNRTVNYYLHGPNKPFFKIALYHRMLPFEQFRGLVVRFISFHSCWAKKPGDIVVFFKSLKIFDSLDLTNIVSSIRLNYELIGCTRNHQTFLIAKEYFHHEGLYHLIFEYQYQHNNKTTQNYHLRKLVYLTNSHNIIVSHNPILKKRWFNLTSFSGILKHQSIKSNQSIMNSIESISWVRLRNSYWSKILTFYFDEQKFDYGVEYGPQSTNFYLPNNQYQGFKLELQVNDIVQDLAFGCVLTFKHNSTNPDDELYLFGQNKEFIYSETSEKICMIDEFPKPTLAYDQFDLPNKKQERYDYIHVIGLQNKNINTTKISCRQAVIYRKCVNAISLLAHFKVSLTLKWIKNGIKVEKSFVSQGKENSNWTTYLYSDELIQLSDKSWHLTYLKCESKFVRHNKSIYEEPIHISSETLQIYLPYHEIFIQLNHEDIPVNSSNPIEVTLNSTLICSVKSNLGPFKVSWNLVLDRRFDLGDHQLSLRLGRYPFSRPNEPAKLKLPKSLTLSEEHYIGMCNIERVGGKTPEPKMAFVLFSPPTLGIPISSLNIGLSVTAQYLILPVFTMIIILMTTIVPRIVGLFILSRRRMISQNIDKTETSKSYPIGCFAQQHHHKKRSHRDLVPQANQRTNMILKSPDQYTFTDKGLLSKSHKFINKHGKLRSKTKKRICKSPIIRQESLRLRRLRSRLGSKPTYTNSYRQWKTQPDQI